MQRVDEFFTESFGDLKIRRGSILPYGASIVPGGVNFSISSTNATSISLALFHSGDEKPFAVIPIEKKYQIGNAYAIAVADLDLEDIEYGYIVDGPNNPNEGHWFNTDNVLLDPYARLISGRNVWGEVPENGRLKPFRGKILRDDFDWQGDKSLEIPANDLIIYEAHVRGFTMHPESGVSKRGTFAGLREKIPYLKKLGVNAIELLPIQEFDEFEQSNPNLPYQEGLKNYWGYSTVGFFAPKAGYAATGAYGLQADELKTLVRELHKNGIEVIMDVVFNHTAEGNERGPAISFRGIDNKTYYMLTPEGWYYNFSGCGNTLNCNNPVVRDMIVDCLRYWAEHYHIDGFRFDLASILGRDPDGTPNEKSPLIERLAKDPILGKVKLIAEAWDAAGLYQVGSFPSWGRWSEWNGKYRDDVRHFLKGDYNHTWAVSKGLEGSPHVYDHEGERAEHSSVNFITCHDGFPLIDLFTYNEKSNWANNEENRDGTDNNISWDHRIEGWTHEQIQELRKKQVKNALSILLMSRGIPLMLAGDEFGNSQDGNNNTYCQDNELGWLDWSKFEENEDIFEYVKRLIEFRKYYSCLRASMNVEFYAKNGYPNVSHHGYMPWQPKFDTKYLGTMFTENEDFIYVAMNMDHIDHEAELPVIPEDLEWSIAMTPDENAKQLEGNKLFIPSRTVVILEAVRGREPDAKFESRSFPASIGEIPYMQNFIARFIKGAPDTEMQSILISSEEIISNVVKYAYTHKKGNVYVDLNLNRQGDNNTIIITVRDNGKPFNPLVDAEATVRGPIEFRPVGGLGILLVKQMMDEVYYVHENGQNIFSMVKHY